MQKIGIMTGNQTCKRCGSQVVDYIDTYLLADKYCYDVEKEAYVVHSVKQYDKSGWFECRKCRNAWGHSSTRQVYSLNNPSE